MKHINDLTITKNNQDKFKNLTKVSGYLDVRADFKAPNLQTVGGYLDVQADFKAPKLQAVGGYLWVRTDFEAPNLQTVGGPLYVRTDLKAPKLQAVGGYLDVQADFEAPNLQTVGGPLYVRTDLKAPKLDKNKKITRQEVRKIVEQAFERQGYLFADGILQKIISKKSVSSLIVYKVKHIAKDETFFCVYDGENYSHGKTLEEAKEDLIFKVSNRDTSEFKAWSLTDSKPLSEMIAAYRSITGACSFGTKEFCKSRELKESYTLKEVFELTKGQYGSDKFKEFFV